MFFRSFLNYFLNYFENTLKTLHEKQVAHRSYMFYESRFSGSSMGPRVGRGGAASGAGKARAATVVPDAAARSPSSRTRGHRALSDVLCASLWADFSAGVGHSGGQVHLGSAFQAYRCRATAHLAICHHPLYERQGSRHKFLAVQPHMPHVHHCGPVHGMEL